jgi:hypothetical protein
MAEIIDIEHLRIRRDEEIRECALTRFPWEEMDQIKSELVDPLTRFWPASRKVILLELLYRLVFEAYVAGMKEGKKDGWVRGFFFKKRTEDDLSPFGQKVCDRLLKELTEEFNLYRCLDEWSVESVAILMQELGKQWFIKGKKAGRKRK